MPRMQRMGIPGQVFDATLGGGYTPTSDDPIMGDLLDAFLGATTGGMQAGTALGRSGAGRRPISKGSSYEYFRFPGMGRAGTERIDRMGGNKISGTWDQTPTMEGMYLHPEDPSKWSQGYSSARSPYGPNTQERFESRRSETNPGGGRGGGRYAPQSGRILNRIRGLFG